MERDLVLILDFGSQYTQLIARRIRELAVYCEIVSFDKAAQAIAEKKPRALVLSGGPSSVYGEGAPTVDRSVLECGVPILGICYGLQLVAKLFGGHVARADAREYGPARVSVDTPSGVFSRFVQGDALDVWMSHGDRIESLPPEFVAIGTSDNTPYCAVEAPSLRFYGLQFHPEVHHTKRGRAILEAFLFDVVGLSPTWTAAGFVDDAVARVRRQIGEDRAVLGLSGGVDSSVAAAICARAIGDRLTCIFVDNGLLRLDEGKRVMEMFARTMHLRVVHVDASRRFLDALEGATDPEVKRKTIGRVFIDVFEEEARKIEGAKFLVQGTLYPDVIESVSHKGPSAVIKSHHNVGGLPERMHLALCEPLRELFKDEVRAAGLSLGLPREVLYRHPFPGPGLAVRCLGPLTAKRLDALRLADAIFEEELRRADLYDAIWQAFAVILPVRTVGVMGDERTYDEVIALRAVESTDGMTADWYRIPHDVLARASTRIINEVPGVNRVAYDISSKPPSTIEWE
ncbi:MAG: glutamine-hydrolyzing GMP synthase [Polyangiaceae bacterium]